jgi:pimeloyl-ACP methyl ester carboxylesterase
MPYANNQGLRIHYQVVGQGMPLVLLHGLYASWGDWYEAGYVAALKNSCRLLLVDGRGHGASDKPHEPEAYAMNLLVDDIVAVLDAEHVAKASFLGYSWGACIGFGVGHYAQERFHALMLGGHAPQAGDTEVVELFLGNLSGGVEAFATWLDQIFQPSEAGYKARRLGGDFEAFTAATRAWRDYSGFDAWLPTMPMPCLLYIGEADGGYGLLKDSADRVPRGTFVSFPGLDHVQAYMHSDVVVPHLSGFLRQVG